MNQWILEFEGFELSRGFVFKEISLRSLDNLISQHFFIKAPCRFLNLTDSDKSIVRWCEKNYHKINWRSGNVKFATARNILKDVLDENSV